MALMTVHVSTKLVLRLDAVDEGGKRRTKRVTVSGIREDASADALLAAAKALGALLEYPVTAVELHTVSVIERCDSGGEEELANLTKDAPHTNIPVPRAFARAIPAPDAFFPFAGLAERVLSPVLLWQRDALMCRGIECGRYRAPPSVLAQGWRQGAIYGEQGQNTPRKKRRLMPPPYRLFR